PAPDVGLRAEEVVTLPPPVTTSNDAETVGGQGLSPCHDLHGRSAQQQVGVSEPDQITIEPKDWIRVYLADGPVKAKEVKQALKFVCITEQTVKRAKAELGVHSHKIAKAWFWFLPLCEQCAAKQPPPLPLSSSPSPSSCSPNQHGTAPEGEEGEEGEDDEEGQGGGAGPLEPPALAGPSPDAPTGDSDASDGSAGSNESDATSDPPHPKACRCYDCIDRW